MGCKWFLYFQALLDYGTVLLLDAGETVQLNTFINRGRVYTELEQYQFALEVSLPVYLV